MSIMSFDARRKANLSCYLLLGAFDDVDLYILKDEMATNMDFMYLVSCKSVIRILFKGISLFSESVYHFFYPGYR